MSKFQQDTKNIWFPNQKEPVYDPQDPISDYQFKEYWKRERERCINGFDIADGQVRIDGFLYWHTVYWKIGMYIELPNKRKVREIKVPLLRDIEWDICNNDIPTCEREGLFYDLVGSRDFGKSIIAASRAAWGYTFFDNSECVISGGADNYIKLATDKIEDGLTNLHPIWKKQRISNDWKKEIKAGWKDKKTNQPDPKSSNSRILVRNYENGNKSMAANGTRPSFHLIDEIGTIPNLIGCVKDSDGCWWSGGGNKPSCLVMRCGCVCAGTKVWTASGKLVNIEDLKQKDGILGYNGETYSKEEITWMKPPSKKLCYRIITTSGNILECSEDHPLMMGNRKLRTIKKGIKNVSTLQFKQAKDIKIGDHLYSVDKIDLFGEEYYNHARLTGMLIGDGYYCGSHISLSIEDEGTRSFIESNYKNSIRKNFETKNGDLYTDLSILKMVPYFKSIGIYNQSKFHKRLPTNIDTYNKEALSELIAGYFDADGNVYYNSKKNTTRIVLTSIVEELLQQVKFQLNKFGIHSYICREERNTKPLEEYIGQQDHIFRLYISKDEDVYRFKQEIPIIHTKKVKALNSFIKGNRDIGRSLLTFKFNSEFPKGRYFKDRDFLNGLVFDRVSSVECIGEKEVYNLTAGTTHTYLANGILTSNTGGDMEVGGEASEIFFAPESYNGLAFDNPERPGTKMGRFIPATKAKMAYKEPKTLAEYIRISHPDLDKITILVSNEEKCLKEWWEPEYAKAVKSGNPKTILKFKAYWPLVPSHSFLVLTANDFNIDAAKAQQVRLRNSNSLITPVTLIHDGEKITHEFTDKVPITQFPCKDQSKDAPVCILEFPPENIPFGLYTAGVDPYRFSEAEYSDSLGAVYIFKRIHEINSEKYSDMFVAWYVARPNLKSTWQEQARLLIKMYGAITLCENDEYSFIDYMVSKGDGHYIADKPEWIKQLIPNSTDKRAKGVSRASQSVRNMLDGTYKSYMDDEFHTEKDENGSVLVSLTGVSKIYDPMLLEETIKYNNKKGNFDRIVAAELAIAQARKMDPYYTVKSVDDDPRLKSYFNKKRNKNSGLFTGSNSILMPNYRKQKSLFR